MGSASRKIESSFSGSCTCRSLLFMRIGSLLSLGVLILSLAMFSGCGGGASAQPPAKPTPTPSPGPSPTPPTSGNFQVAVSFTGNGTGAVVSTPEGISCRTGSNKGCSDSLSAGTSVKLAVTPDPSMVFAGWQGGACSGTAPTCTFTVSANTNVVVNLNQAPPPPPANSQVTVLESGGGQGSVVSNPAGINCPGTCSATFADGTQISLTATAASGSAFGGYSGACSTTGATIRKHAASPSPTCTFSASGNESVTAVFTTTQTPPPPPPQQSLAVTVTGQGTVTSNPAGIDCPGTCSANFNQGTVVTLTAGNTTKGWTFNNWGDACASQGNPCQVTITNTNQSVTATFMSPDLTYNGGAILPTTTTKVIFWGVKWGDSSFVGDKISGIDSWYEGVGGSSYAGSVDEYTDASGNQVTASSSYTGHVIDTTAGSDSGAPGEACKLTTNPVPNEYVAVYLDQPPPGGFCAYHTYVSCANSNTQLQVAVFYNLDGGSCNVLDNVTGHSQGLAALANMSGHEFSEARTDPFFTAWYDTFSQETSDKCESVFPDPFVTFSNGSQWKIQANWSNYAYDNNLGQESGGCVDFNVTGK